MIDEAKQILAEPLPSCLKDCAALYSETTGIIHKLYKHRECEMSEGLRDFLMNKPKPYFGPVCGYIYDAETETVIDELNKRKEKIHNARLRFVSERESFFSKVEK